MVKHLLNWTKLVLSSIYSLEGGANCGAVPKNDPWKMTPKLQVHWISWPDVLKTLEVNLTYFSSLLPQDNLIKQLRNTQPTWYRQKYQNSIVLKAFHKFLRIHIPWSSVAMFLNVRLTQSLTTFSSSNKAVTASLETAVSSIHISLTSVIFLLKETWISNKQPRQLYLGHFIRI